MAEAGSSEQTGHKTNEEREAQAGDRQHRMTLLWFAVNVCQTPFLSKQCLLLIAVDEIGAVNENYFAHKFERLLIMLLFHRHVYAHEGFEGPLDFLICLLQKGEVDIQDISIQSLVQQFYRLFSQDKNRIESGAEFLAYAAQLIWMKSASLLPTESAFTEEIPIEEDPRFEIIHHLIDYCRFKQVAKELAERQERESACFTRGVEIPEIKKPLGIDHITLEELASLFQEAMKKKPAVTLSEIQEEEWRVKDKIDELQRSLARGDFLLFPSCFENMRSRGEMIALFLAILELVKIGELTLKREGLSTEIRMERYAS